MIHYHGLPITPETAAIHTLKGGHGFVSFSTPDQLHTAAAVCQSFALDNGAFSAWRNGTPITDWSEFYGWAADCRRIPSCDFAVIPDVIDGSEADNDRLVDAWPLPMWFGAPVWHLHESLERLRRLVFQWPRVCIGSSGDFAQIKTARWWARMSEAMRVACDDEGWPRARLHGLRMLDQAVFTRFPFSSVDSTNIGRNIGLDCRWESGAYQPRTKEGRAIVMRERIESFNAPARWNFMPIDLEHPAQGVLL
jgi:hypothetical protein